MWSLYPVHGLFVALAVFLAADVAGGGQVGEHLAEVLRELPLETRRLRLPPPVRPCVDVRACAAARDYRRRGIVFAVVGLGLDFASPRASISVASRAIAPMMRPPSARSISAALILSGSAPRANSANAPENVASEGTCEPRSQPRMRRRDLSTSRRSIRALVMGTPRTAGEGEEAWSVCEPLPVLSASRRAATIGACSRTDDRRFRVSADIDLSYCNL